LRRVKTLKQIYQEEEVVEQEEVEDVEVERVGLWPRFELLLLLVLVVFCLGILP
jgi:hypothetical protein